MLAIFAVVAPVFLLIASGYVGARRALVSDAGIDGLLAFVVRIAVPALLFLNMYRLPLDDVFEPGALIAFYAGAFLSFGLGVALGRAFGRRPGESVAIGFAGFFSNTVLIGLPIMESAYGVDALTPMFGLIALHAPLLYTTGFITMEAVRRDGAGIVAGAARVGRSMARNALMIGIVLGLTLNLLSAPLPQPMIDALDRMSAAVPAVALFTLGAALTRYRLQAEISLALLISAVLLVAHPAVAYVLGVYVFDLDAPHLRAAVVTASMPAGLNVYVFAAMYQRGEGVAASAVLLSTALSVVTISAWLAILGGAG